jgi:zinc protease
VEALVVGDVDLESAVAAMRKTVAALRRRAPAPAPTASLAVRPPVPDPAPVTFTHKGDPAQAWAAVGWTTFGGLDRVRERRALSVGANIAQVRLMERLRDEAGATYSPFATLQSSESFPAWGVFYAGAEIRPENRALFFRLARETVAELAAKPVATDEWARAINPVLSGIERRLKTNAYWMGAMENWSRDRRFIEAVRSYQADYAALTPEEVRAAIARWVADEGDWSMVVLPAKAAGGVD